MEKPQSKYELEALIDYCINRKLIRPKTNFITAIKFLVVFEIATLLIVFCASKLLVFVGFNYDLSLLHLFVSIMLLIVVFKRFSILLIELYQHYASDKQRRKCKLKPSCSEYAIIVLNKYCLLKALNKIYIRLFVTCNGTYGIDNP